MFKKAFCKLYNSVLEYYSRCNLDRIRCKKPMLPIAFERMCEYKIEEFIAEVKENSYTIDDLESFVSYINGIYPPLRQDDCIHEYTMRTNFLKDVMNKIIGLIKNRKEAFEKDKKEVEELSKQKMYQQFKQFMEYRHGAVQDCLTDMLLFGTGYLRVSKSKQESVVKIPECNAIRITTLRDNPNFNEYSLVFSRNIWEDCFKRISSNLEYTKYIINIEYPILFIMGNLEENSILGIKKLIASLKNDLNPYTPPIDLAIEILEKVISRFDMLSQIAKNIGAKVDMVSIIEYSIRYIFERIKNKEKSQEEEPKSVGESDNDTELKKALKILGFSDSEQKTISDNLKGLSPVEPKPEDTYKTGDRVFFVKQRMQPTELCLPYLNVFLGIVKDWSVSPTGVPKINCTISDAFNVMDLETLDLDVGSSEDVKDLIESNDFSKALIKSNTKSVYGDIVLCVVDEKYFPTLNSIVAKIAKPESQAIA